MGYTTTTTTTSGTKTTTPKPLDGGWGWVVVAAGFMAQFLAYGSPQSVGVLYPEWLHIFQEGKGMTAWVGSLAVGVGLIVSPICSACVINFGARPVTIFSGVMVSGGLMLSAFAPNIPFLIFSYGIVVGIGCGLEYAATLTITCLYFDKKKGLALGIVTTGASVGGFLYATLQNELIELFGLHGCLLITGALALNLIACAGPMRPLTPPKYYLKQRAALLERAAEEQLRPIKPAQEPAMSTEKPVVAKETAVTIDTKEMLATERRSLFSCSALVKLIKTKLRDYSRNFSSTLALLQDRVFMALCISLFLFALGTIPPLLFLEDVAQSEGLLEGVAALPLVSIISIMGAVGKMGLGIMADLPFINSIFLYAFTTGASGLALLFIPLTKSYMVLQILSATLGFLSGNWSLTPYITTQVVGAEKLTEAHGILMFFGGFGIIMGPPVVGWFYDLTQSYHLAFYFSGGCVILGGLILFIAALPCLEYTKPEPPPSSESFEKEFIEHTIRAVPDPTLPSMSTTSEIVSREQ
ncbi:monocarboxylate transporter 9-like [Polymixia lowei]